MGSGRRPKSLNPAGVLERFAPGPTDLLREATYRRLWISIVISSLGRQVTLLALPLTAAVMLNATPMDMGVLTAAELAPFALFGLPAGVWLDRVHKLPVYVLGEITIAVGVIAVPVAWWLDRLSMGWLYAIGFLLGLVNTVARGRRSDRIDPGRAARTTR